MFTDIVGYTSLSQRDESLAMELLEEHRKLVRPLFAKHDGKEIKTIGDAFLVEFESALEAVRCAYGIQQLLHDTNARHLPDKKLELRIGVHLGDVIHDENDVYGDAVNIASRIEPLADPGGICVTEQVYSQIKNKFEFPFSSLGKRELKNIGESIEVYRVLVPWQKVRTVADVPNDHRIAILPFANMSPDPNDEYFADGMTEEIISTVSKLEQVEVISRTSVMQYKKSAKPMREISKELEVGTILEGSVRKSGDRLRVTVQMIDAVRDRHLWVESYDREFRDVFVIQSDVARKVANALQTEFTKSKSSGARPTSNLDAYTLWLRGRIAGSKLSKESLMKAIEYYEKATALDPEFGACFAYLAHAWLLLGFFELIPSEEGFSKAKSYAMKALKLDDSLAEGHVALGRILRLYDWKFLEAEDQLRRATELEPNLATAHAFRAQGLEALGRDEEAIAEAKKALELDPLSVTVCMVNGTIYLYSRKYDEAIEMYNRALEIGPNSPFPMGNLGLTFVQKGQVEEGIALLEKATQIEPSNASSKNDLAYAYAKAGRIDDVKRILKELEEMRTTSKRNAVAIAGVHTILGDYEKAFEWLNKAIDEHNPYAASIVRDFIFDPLRLDQRYQSLLKRIGIME